MEGGGWEIDSDSESEVQSAGDPIGRLLASDPNKDKHTLVKASVVMLSFTCRFSQNVKFRSILLSLNLPCSTCCCANTASADIILILLIMMFIQIPLGPRGRAEAPQDHIAGSDMAVPVSWGERRCRLRILWKDQ